MSLETLRKKEWVWLVVLAALFIVLRLPAVHSPYHQDEYKWVQYSHPEITPEGTVPHPPLTELIYAKTLGPLAGDENFRFIPLLFGLANLFLVFYLAKTIFGERSALWTTFLFAVSFYSVLASLMVDVDGVVMPFFFLLMAIGYFRLKKNNFRFSILDFSFLILGAVGGFMIKVSGILPIFALFFDFLIEKGVFSDKKRILKYLGFSLLGLLCLAILLFAAKFIFPFFNLEYSLKYWEHFMVLSGRGWLQTFIQFAKAVLYSSPLLILPAFFADKELWNKARPFFFFIFTGLVFYLFAFDFSLGALDRYFQFLVAPLCLVSGAVFAKFLGGDRKIPKEDMILISIIGLSIFVLQFFPHFVPPLYPKTEWLSRILSLKWNFLYPFSGGSGPLGFYVSFLFMALIWVVCAIFAVSTLKIKNIKSRVMFSILIIGIMYNAAFIEEYLFGKINGSAPGLVRDSVEFIKNDPSVKKVVVYNDNGGWDVRETGKYARRMYATPQFEEEYRKYLSDFSGHILLINIPKIQEDSFYTDYFASRCRSEYSRTDRYITASVLKCDPIKR